MSELLKHPGESSNDNLTPEGKAAAHSRRTFLFKLALALNGAVGLVLAVPLVGYLLGPAMKKGSKDGSWIAIGPTSDFQTGETRLVDFESPVSSLGDGQTAKVACWVRRIYRTVRDVPIKIRISRGEAHRVLADPPSIIRIVPPRSEAVQAQVAVEVAALEEVQAGVGGVGLRQDVAVSVVGDLVEDVAGRGHDHPHRVLLIGQIEFCLPAG